MPGGTVAVVLLLAMSTVARPAHVPGVDTSTVTGFPQQVEQFKQAPLRVGCPGVDCAPQNGNVSLVSDASPQHGGLRHEPTGRDPALEPP